MNFAPYIPMAKARGFTALLINDKIRLLCVRATRKKLDGRCENRKSKGNHSKRSYSLNRCKRDFGVIQRIDTALTDKLRVSGKQKSPIVGNEDTVFFAYLNFVEVD